MNPNPNPAAVEKLAQELYTKFTCIRSSLSYKDSYRVYWQPKDFVGTNSTGMIVGMYERGIRPDYITFADTGGEKPHTYRHLADMQIYLKSIGFPEIVIVKKVDKNGDVLTLEENCLNKKMLPSLAYGYKKCSQKFKIAPQDKYFNNIPETKAYFKAGCKVKKFIGYDAFDPDNIKAKMLIKLINKNKCFLIFLRSVGKYMNHIIAKLFF